MTDTQRGATANDSDRIPSGLPISALVVWSKIQTLIGALRSDGCTVAFHIHDDLDGNAITVTFSAYLPWHDEVVNSSSTLGTLELAMKHVLNHLIDSSQIPQHFWGNLRKPD
jgi:hypothetical protein